MAKTPGEILFSYYTRFIFGPVDMSLKVLLSLFFVLQLLMLSFEQSECMLRESLCNFKESQKKLKSSWSSASELALFV